jgi:hypothetical protein
MNFLKGKDKDGVFVFKDCAERMLRQVLCGHFPTLEEFWNQEIYHLPFRPNFNIHKRIGAKDDFSRRIWKPSMDEALAALAIKIHSKEFEVIPITKEEDWDFKIDLKLIDLKLNSLAPDDLTIVQVKNNMPNLSKLVFENSCQIGGFGRTAEYMKVRFEVAKLPNCYFIYVNNGVEKIYKSSEVDFMLREMRRSQVIKIRGI